jgi:hypothetical protein
VNWLLQLIEEGSKTGKGFFKKELVEGVNKILSFYM